MLSVAADLVDLCGRIWPADGLLLRSHSASRRFYFVAPDTDCGLWVRAAAPGDRIRLQFRFFLVYSLAPPSVPPALNASAPLPADPCAPGSYLQLYEGPPGTPRPLGAPLCGLTIPAPVTTSGDLLGLRLVTRGRQPRVDFVGEVTSFRLGGLGRSAWTRRGRGPAGEKRVGWSRPRANRGDLTSRNSHSSINSLTHKAQVHTSYPQLHTPGTHRLPTHDPPGSLRAHSLAHTVRITYTSYTVPLCTLPGNSCPRMFTQQLLCPESASQTIAEGQRARTLGDCKWGKPT